MLRIVRDDEGHDDPDLDPIPFPRAEDATPPQHDDFHSEEIEPLDFDASPNDILDAIDSMSRHIDDLAREFNCFNHFDEDPDDGPPRAA